MTVDDTCDGSSLLYSRLIPSKKKIGEKDVVVFRILGGVPGMFGSYVHWLLFLTGGGGCTSPAASVTYLAFTFLQCFFW